ncbi:MAG: glycosyltransferase family 4 protein [bacterium]|nr:glycosyltransferase family 4 protein [bacterium]
MRIYFITTKLNFVNAGGSVRDIDLRAKALVEMGHTVTVISAFPESNIITESLPYQVKEEFIRSRGLLGIQIGAHRIIKKYEQKADVFHVDGQVFLYAAGWYRLMGGRVPVLSLFNHWLNAWADETQADVKPVKPYWWWAKWLKKKLRFFLERRLGVFIANRADAFIFDTPQIEKKFISLGFNAHKGFVLPDFVDTQGSLAGESMTMDKIISHQQPRRGIVTILLTGRMLPEKGFDMAIKAFVSLPNKENYRVIMSGTGPELNNLQRQVSELKLQDFFYFPGWVDREELLSFFQQAQIFIFPNWWPEYGSVTFEEAMSFGLASIIPDGGALEWLSGGTAFTFKSNNVADLSRAMQQLGEDTNLRIKIAQKSLEHIVKLDYRIVGRELERILKSIVQI